MRLDATAINALLEAVAGKMRDLGVEKFQFQTLDAENPLERVQCLIELGARPVSEDAAEEARVQRLRDSKEIEKLDRERRRMFAASPRIGPGFKPLR
jgi:hypothetical protein